MGLKMLWYEDAEKDERWEQTNRWKRLEAHKPLFQIAMEYGCRFSHNHEHSYGNEIRAANMSFAMGGGTINCLALDLYLGIEDTMTKEVGPILEELKEHPRLKFVGDSDYIEMGWKGWDFKYENGNGIPDGRLLVRCWFEASNRCKKIGTGKFEEVMKVECES